MDGRGEASSTIQIGAVFSIEPASVEVAPENEVRFAIHGAAGDVEYELGSQSQSGGSVSQEGVYRAGSNEGIDTLVVRDSRTGAESTAIVRIRENAALEVPVPMLVIPVGSAHPLEWKGGSGHVDVESTNDAVSIDDNSTLRAASPGMSTVSLRDRYTSMTLEFTVVSASSTEADTFPVGRSAQVKMLADDLDHDGHVDAIVALEGSNVGGIGAGAVLVHRGTSEGLESEPGNDVDRPLKGRFLWACD